MKKIIITGASSGIGRALAETFASRGVKVGAAARSIDVLEGMARTYPGMIEAVELDVTKPRAVEALHSLIEQMGGMDLYIHVAGIALRNPEMNPENEVAVTQTNTEGLARMCCAAFSYFMHSKRPGQIAAISSVAGTRGIGELAAYSASKAFDSTYLEALRQLARTKNLDISITDIRPGWIRTPLVDPDKKYPLEMSIDYVIPQILRAIVHRRRVATIDWRWALLCTAWRRIPSPLWENLHGFGL
ncbi:MAG: SDR family NAD(P)-dependent oxidoreductase [Prevotella sp.]|nr:SDR family NAD(P)-dependent oxidoreductase [Prevotella sp.]MCM1074602.1 SDR family NAD(P)-dependent oxidoreductase [Ruminococcus sp.]